MGYSVPKDEIKEGGFELPREGWHRFIASHTEETKTSKGDRMYRTRLYPMDDTGGGVLAFDNITLGGPGAGIGLQKMQAISCVDDLGDEWDFAYPHEVDGSRGWCYISHYEYDTRQKREKNSGSRPEDLETKAQVNIRHGQAGYMPIDWTPPGYGEGGGAQGIPPTEDDDIPF